MQGGKWGRGLQLGEKSAAIARVCGCNAAATRQCRTVQLHMKSAFHPTATVTSFQLDLETDPLKTVPQIKSLP